jgi:hypothetical protein
VSTPLEDSYFEIALIALVMALLRRLQHPLFEYFVIGHTKYAEISTLQPNKPIDLARKNHSAAAILSVFYFYYLLD